MNLNYQELLPADFDPSSRVWIYQSNRRLTITEALRAEELLEEFVRGWLSHGEPVKGYANLLFGQFIVLMADITATNPGGCSTDSSVRAIKSLEQQLGLQLFDRQSLAFLVKDKIELLPYAQLNYAAENGFITPDTLYFNNTVQTKKELDNHWIIPVKDSWLKSRIRFKAITHNG